jgi:hypothetical protein
MSFYGSSRIQEQHPSESQERRTKNEIRLYN